jgi:Ca2+:H+ antiporter
MAPRTFGNLSCFWPIWIPASAFVALLIALVNPPHVVLHAACAALLLGAVVSAVHHAEVVAHRLGEPLGTLVLALAVTAIEVALILSMMYAGGVEKATLARDTIFATVMIISSGIMGICILVGGLRHREQFFRIEGTGPALAALTALATLILIMPSFTKSAPGSSYSSMQMAFVGFSSLCLWCVFVFFQTVRHRDYFLPLSEASNETAHALPPTNWRALTSFGLLLLSLVSVVGLAKVLSPALERAVETAGASKSMVGIVIAAVVLLPEATAAIRAALANRLQTSMNLAYGSALASIGLTIPAVVLAAYVLEFPLVLGLEAKDMVLLILSLFVAAIGLGNGRTNMMQGAVQIVLFAAFLFLAIEP